MNVSIHPLDLEAAEMRRRRADHESRSLEALTTALERVPAYQAWRALDPGPGASVDRRFAALPALTKGQLRDGPPDRFVPHGRDLGAGLASGEVTLAETSGSTDDRVTVVFSVPWWEASERAAWRLNAHAERLATPERREAVLASPRCVGPGYAERPRTVRERTLGRHLYLNEKLNPATWTDGDVRRMAAELRQYAPQALEGDPPYLAAFARRAQALGLELARPELVLLTYSYPSRIYVRDIRQAFGAPIASSYGSTETGHVFFECEAGRLHQNTDHCRVDLQLWRRGENGGRRGRMLVTVLRNPWFQVLRFDIGDVARLDDRGPCPCGRRDGLTLASIDGRIKDVTFAADGRAITVDDLDRRLAEVEGLNGWQLDLPSPGVLQMRVLADAADADRIRRQTAEILRREYGPDAPTEVVVAAALEHESSGKFRFARAAFDVNHRILWEAQT